MAYVHDRDGLAACPDDPARVAPPDFNDSKPADLSDMLSVLAGRSQHTTQGRTAGQLAIALADMRFFHDLPHGAVLEILRHVAKNASTDWRYTRGHLIDYLEEIQGES